MKNKKVTWILVCLTCVFSFFGWFLVYRELYSENTHWQWVWSVIFFFMALVLFSLTLFIAVKRRQFYILIFSVLFFSLMLGGERWYAMILALAISFFLAQTGAFIIKNEQKQRIKINLFRTLRRGMPFIGTALSLLLASGFYFSLLNNQKLGQAPRVEIKIPKTMNGIKICQINHSFDRDGSFG